MNANSYIEFKEHLNNEDNFLLSLVNLLKECQSMDELRALTEGTDLHDRLQKVSKLPFAEAQAHLLDRARSLTVQLTYRKQLEAQFAIKQLCCVIAHRDRRIDSLIGEMLEMRKELDGLLKDRVVEAAKAQAPPAKEPAPAAKAKKKAQTVETDGTNAGSGE